MEGRFLTTVITIIASGVRNTHAHKGLPLFERAGVLAGLTDYLQFTLFTTLLPPAKRMLWLRTTSHRLTLVGKRREICAVVFA